MTTPTIEELHNLGYFSGLDYYFARTMGRMAGEEDSLVLLAAGAVSRCTRQGHVCLDLRSVAETDLSEDIWLHRALSRLGKEAISAAERKQ